MKYWVTNNGTKIYRVLSGRSNAYLVVNNTHAALIDTGTSSAYSKLLSNIARVDLQGKIDCLILTHTHFDHCQSAYKVKVESQCKIVVSKNAENSVANGYTRIPNGTFLYTKLISKVGRFIGKKRFGYHTFSPDILIENSEYRIPSLNVKIIETPGHSSDSISIVVDNEIAIVGDAMFGVFKNSILTPFADNKNKLVESWKKCLDTDCNLFLPGHGHCISRKLLEKQYYRYKTKA